MKFFNTEIPETLTKNRFYESVFIKDDVFYVKVAYEPYSDTWVAQYTDPHDKISAVANTPEAALEELELEASEEVEEAFSWENTEDEDENEDVITFLGNRVSYEEPLKIYDYSLEYDDTDETFNLSDMSGVLASAYNAYDDQLALNALENMATPEVSESFEELASRTS